MTGFLPFLICCNPTSSKSNAGTCFNFGAYIFFSENALINSASIVLSILSAFSMFTVSIYSPVKSPPPSVLHIGRFIVFENASLNAQPQSFVQFGKSIISNGASAKPLDPTSVILEKSISCGNETHPPKAYSPIL